MNIRALGVAAFFVLLFTGGCIHLGQRSPVPAPAPIGAKAPTPLDRAEALYSNGEYDLALIECVDIAHRDPNTPGLAELRTRVLTAQVEKRTRAAGAESELTGRKLQVEATEQAKVPDTYGMKKTVQGESGSLRTEPSAMQKLLRKPVTMHLKGVDLATFIDAISKDQNVNIIADRGLGAGRQADIEMDQVPLGEVFDYLSRNLGVEFFVGQNAIWATAASANTKAPLETRIYRLRKGLQFHAGDWRDSLKPSQPNPQQKPGTSLLSGLTDKAGELASLPTALEDAIKRFLPQVQGSEYMVDRDSHALIARSTRANLILLEDLIEALDISPPQVLIEARFVETTVADMRELGIDWLLNSPIGVSYKTVTQNGVPVSVPKAEITAAVNNGLITHDPYAPGDKLGPVGAFSEIVAGESTAAQGLNLAFSGILTKPMFSAVLHALDISGKGRTLSVPRVTTVNNNPAKLRNGEDLLYYDEFQAQAFNLGSVGTGSYYTPNNITVLVPKGKPLKEELGITLVAVPSVGSDLKTISLMLVPTISEFVGWTSYQDYGATNMTSSKDIQQAVVRLPKIQRQEVQTKVNVESGETVVLGGLVKAVKQNTLHKVPILSSIPLLGVLFQRTDTTEQERNLLIFVTATVISERGESLVPRAVVSVAK